MDSKDVSSSGPSLGIWGFGAVLASLTGKYVSFPYYDGEDLHSQSISNSSTPISTAPRSQPHSQKFSQHHQHQHQHQKPLNLSSRHPHQQPETITSSSSSGHTATTSTPIAPLPSLSSPRGMSVPRQDIVSSHNVGPLESYKSPKGGMTNAMGVADETENESASLLQRHHPSTYLPT